MRAATLSLKSHPSHTLVLNTSCTASSSSSSVVTLVMSVCCEYATRSFTGSLQGPFAAPLSTLALLQNVRVDTTFQAPIGAYYTSLTRTKQNMVQEKRVLQYRGRLQFTLMSVLSSGVAMPPCAAGAALNVAIARAAQASATAGASPFLLLSGHQALRLCVDGVVQFLPPPLGPFEVVSVVARLEQRQVDGVVGGGERLKVLHCEVARVLQAAKGELGPRIVNIVLGLEAMHLEAVGVGGRCLGGFSACGQHALGHHAARGLRQRGRE